MPHTRSRRRRRYRVLRSETPSTVAVLVTEQDFAAMRGYRTFIFDDYTGYLRHVHQLLRSLDALGVHTRVAPFDPDGYAAYCFGGGLDPDASLSRTRYTADIAGTGLTIPYTGETCEELLPLLRTHRTTEAAQRESARLLACIEAPGPCGAEEAAFHTAADAVDALLLALGPGTHHLVCSVDGPEQPLLAVLHAVAEPGGMWGLDESAVLVFCSVLATGLATGSPGGLVTRTTPGPGEGGAVRETVRGWCLQHGWLKPLTEGEVFSAYCTHAETGEPLAPEPGVDYGAGIPLPRRASTES